MKYALRRQEIAMCSPDYSTDRVYYICRWLNHSFRKFSKKEELLYRQFREYYNTIKGK